MIILLEKWEAHMNDEKNEVVPVEITVENLKDKIYMVRGQRVMLAADLAEIYGYSTKAFNQQVKNNIEKFEEDFRFQLTVEEVADLRSKFLTANINPKSRYEPYVFTETGIYMLMRKMTPSTWMIRNMLIP